MTTGPACEVLMPSTGAVWMEPVASIGTIKRSPKYILLVGRYMGGGTLEQELQSPDQIRESVSALVPSFTCTLKR